MYRAGEKGRKKDVGRLFTVVLSAVLLLMMLMGMVLASAEKVLAVDAKSGEALDQASADSAFGELLSNQITGWPAGIDIAPYAAVLMDMDTGTILYGKDMHVQHYPASITKVMTALLAVENGTADQIVGSCARALAISMRCLWPPDMFRPPSRTLRSKPPPCMMSS